MSKTAFVGLGAMGSRTAANLLKAGHEVTVCDLAPEAVKKLADSGAKTAASARDAAENNEFVLTMVRDDEVLRNNTELAKIIGEYFPCVPAILIVRKDLAPEVVHTIQEHLLSYVPDWMNVPSVVQTHLDRTEAVNPKINAIATLRAGEALNDAKAAEAAVLAGGELGPLHGAPFTVKDSIDTAGVLTQRGSPIFKGRMPDADATSVARMKKAGGTAGLLKHRRQDPQKYLREGECADRFIQLSIRLRNHNEQRGKTNGVCLITAEARSLLCRLHVLI